MKSSTISRLLLGIADCVLLILCILLAMIINHKTIEPKFDVSHIGVSLFILCIWFSISFFFRKFRIGEKQSFRNIFNSIVISNFIILSIITMLIALFRIPHYSNTLIFGTIIIATIFEVFLGLFYFTCRGSIFIKDWIGIDLMKEEIEQIAPAPPINASLFFPHDIAILRESMIEESSAEAFDWIDQSIDITDPKTLVVSTNTRFNILNYPSGFYSGIVNLQPVNDIRRINKFFETVNSKLPVGGIFVGCGETYALRKIKILRRYPYIINYFVYLLDFLYHRVCPKLKYTRKVYFLITKGKKRVISQTETLGRLISCGFDIVEEKPIGDLLYWKVRKTQFPHKNGDPTYGILIRLPRIGKDGKEFKVYKFRTMHSYSEYLQSYVHQKNNLGEGGKFKNDPRVTTIGKILRKTWLDEIPMFINVLIRRDMKIVGVRPLSHHYFSLYCKELQEKRIRFKPGLIPPYYAQYPTPKTLEEIQQNELDYLTAYEKHPFLTDIRYFFKAFNNILFHKARSK
jgi:lipopolysaccharide/colanic/teichoic acid biosynthesis glycosyltransferase